MQPCVDLSNRRSTKATSFKQRVLRDFYIKHGPRKKVVIIDVDNTPVETFGFQENQYFNGHYNCKYYLPLLAFIDGYPVGVYNGTTDGRKKMLEVLKPFVNVDQIRSSC